MRDLRRPHHSGFNFALGPRIFDGNFGVFWDPFRENEHTPARAYGVGVPLERLGLTEYVYENMDL